MRPDVTIIHAQRADRRGNVEIRGITGVQKEAVLAARHSIVTVEEIVEAVRAIVTDGVPAEGIDDALFSRYLFTNSLPDPDLIIRTAGEMRISNFLLWQGAYSELFFVDDYWPDFSVTHVDEVLTAYGRRRRRFGSLLPDETDAAAGNGHVGGNGAGSPVQNGRNGA